VVKVIFNKKLVRHRLRLTKSLLRLQVTSLGSAIDSCDILLDVSRLIGTTVFSFFFCIAVTAAKIILS